MQVLTSIPKLGTLLALFPTIKAIFFDMDGTLFPTEKHHALALREVLKEIGIEKNWKDLMSDFAGDSDEQVHQKLSCSIPLDIFLKKKNRFCINFLRSETLLKKEMRELLDECMKASLKLGLVTSSEKKVTTMLLEQEKVSPFFQLVLTREDTPLNKPDPMPYLKAMEALGVSTSESLIIEDSPAGLEAAQKSQAYFVQAKWFEVN